MQNGIHFLKQIKSISHLSYYPFLIVIIPFTPLLFYYFKIKY